MSWDTHTWLALTEHNGMQTIIRAKGSRTYPKTTETRKAKTNYRVSRGTVQVSRLWQVHKHSTVLAGQLQVALQSTSILQSKTSDVSQSMFCNDSTCDFKLIRLWSCRVAAVIPADLDDLDVADSNERDFDFELVDTFNTQHILKMSDQKGWRLVPIIRLSYYSINQGHHITELSRVLILVIFGVIRGDIDVNMQGIKAAVQSSHARARDTCGLLSWPTAHSKPLNIV